MIQIETASTGGTPAYDGTIRASTILQITIADGDLRMLMDIGGGSAAQAVAFSLANLMHGRCNCSNRNCCQERFEANKEPS